MTANDADLEPVRLQVTSVAHGGEAVGRVGGQVVFAAYGLPGEEVDVQITERRKQFLRGRVTHVHQAAPERVSPPCPIFGICGGCQWQHASYGAQLRYKADILREQLQRLGGFADPPVEPAIASAEPWHYRNTVQFTPAAPDSSPNTHHSTFTPWPGQDAASYRRPLCFRQAHSHALVVVDHCYIADPLINTVLAEAPWEALPDDDWAHLSSVVVRVAPPAAAQLTLVTGTPLAHSQTFAQALMARLPAVTGVLEAPTRAGGEARLVAGTENLVYVVGDLRLIVPAGAFFQVALPATLALVHLVADWLAPGGGDRVLDAYAGVGTFALALAGRAREAVAVEADAAAAAAALLNAQRNGLDNVAVHALPVERALPRIRGQLDLAVLDPSRRGCDARFLQALAQRQPRKIVYVSCEPSTLARDLKLLAARGYRLARVQPVDFFPQTYHVESASLLELN